MGQQLPNTKSQKIENPDSIFEPQTSEKYSQRLKQAFRISNQEREKNFQQSDYSLDDIIETQESKILKQNIMLLATEKVAIKKNPYQMQGCLEKQSPTVFGNWDKRYCILQDHRFIYKSDKNKNSQDAGILNFDLLSCSVKTSGKNNKIQSFMIKIQNSDKNFVFRDESCEKNAFWAQKLIKITDCSLGRKYNLTYLTQYNRFWRKDYLSEQQFREKSETGDLILMRGKSNSSAIQRAITLQQFDHVALVLKNIKHQVLLFEATGGIGVGIVPWKRFIQKNWYKNQEIVVYRKLNIKRTQEFNRQVQQFVQRNMGRKYKFSVKKYFGNRQSEGTEDKKSYFCSSLIAKLYKDLQILDQKISSTQYLPSSFAEKQTLPLKQNGKYGNVFLERQKIIVFQKLFFKV